MTRGGGGGGGDERDGGGGGRPGCSLGPSFHTLRLVENVEQTIGIYSSLHSDLLSKRYRLNRSFLLLFDKVRSKDKTYNRSVSP